MLRALVVPALLPSLLVLALGTASSAQFARLTNPKFDVTLTHPPQLALKGVQKLAVREFGGECGLELSERLMQAMAVTGKFEMIDRAHLEGVLQEQGFQNTGAVSGQTTLKVGQLLGPSAMFAGRVTRCSVETSQPLVVPGEFKDSRGLPATKYARRTTAQMTASIVLVDFTTGKTHTGKLVDARAERTNEALNGHPEAPNRDVVQTAMYQDAIRQVMRIIEPWTEVVSIIVYDDDDANKFRLKPSTEQMKRGDFAGAAAAVQALLVQGGGLKVTDKERAKANYNLGIALMYSQRVDEALPILQKSLSLDPGNGIIKEGLSTANRMAALNRERERVEAAAVAFAAEQRMAGVGARQGSQPSGVQQAMAAPASPPLTNSDLLEMLKAKLPESVILAKIKNSPTKFDSSVKALDALKKAGASEAILLAVITPSGGN